MIKPFELRNPDHTRSRVSSFLERYYRQFSDNVCMHTEDELAVFYELAAGFHSENLDGYIVNAGVFHGGSVCIFGQGQSETVCRDNPILAIDFFYGNGGNDNYIRARENFNCYGMGSRICLITFDDRKFFDFFSLPIRVVLIDSNHAYVHVSQILPNVFLNMVDGGWIIAHDYDSASPGTIEAVDEFIENCDAKLHKFQVDKSFIMKVE